MSGPVRIRVTILAPLPVLSPRAPNLAPVTDWRAPFTLGRDQRGRDVTVATYDRGSGPLINPFPRDRSRGGGRAHAHHNPMEPYGQERGGLYRPRVPTRVPRSISDEDLNDIWRDGWWELPSSHQATPVTHATPRFAITNPQVNAPPTDFAAPLYD